MSIRVTDLPALRDVMLPLGKFPAISPKTLFKEALDAMAEAKLGVVCIVDKEGKLLGVFTDGDIRRKLLKIQKPFSAFFADDVSNHMTRDPLTVRDTATLVDAVAAMESKSVWDLPVTDADGNLVGLVHLHPVVKALMGPNA
jgi:CBS domain-containing protein